MTTLTEVQDQIQKFWAPVFVKELRESLLLAALVNKDYQGDLKAQGDTVKVSQVLAPKGKLKTISSSGSDADTFESEPLTTKQVEIKADKRATAAFELQDLVEIQSQIDSESSDIRDSLRFSVDKQINDYLYTLVAPKASHVISGVADFNASELINLRVKAGQAKWLKNKPWWCLPDSVYHGDLLAAQTLTSSDHVADQPVVAGEMPNRRFNWNILEDNSRPVDTALAFHPDFMHLVMQTEAQFKISDLHSQKKFGFLLSVDLIFGAKLGIDGAELHMTVGA